MVIILLSLCKKTMTTIIHRANERGYANHGWLEANHSFSFANWYDPNKVHFGALRVLNDDRVAPAMGFGKHPHDNMEIITIPLSGSLAHEDSMGNGSTISVGEVQVMSAGTGVFHSEKNPSHQDEVRLFQIWIIPNKRNHEPRYDQIQYELKSNDFTQVVSPNENDEGTWINQNSWIHLGQLDENKELSYSKKDPSNGVYLMVIEGEIALLDEVLSKRDAIGIVDHNEIRLTAKVASKVLVIEVPMKLD